jgi:addiction module RelE/StbE family toxin
VPAEVPSGPVELRATGLFKRSFARKNKGLSRPPRPGSDQPATKLDLALKTFVECKRHKPPRPLPERFKDHQLKGALSWCRECHLAPDTLLLYTLDAAALTLLAVVDHDELAGPRGRALARQLRSLREEG